MRQRLIRLALVLVIIAGFVGYEFGYKSAKAKNEQWQGTLVHSYRKRIWWKGIMGPMETRPYLFYNYYWRVQREDGSQLDARVPHVLWQKAQEGDPIRKIQGQRWPLIDTAQAEQERQITGEIVDQLRRQILGDDEPSSP